LIKTRKIYACSKFAKQSYVYLYISQLINSTQPKLNYLNIYSNYVLLEVTKNIWYFYKNLLIADFGLYNSNYTKSVMLKTVDNNYKYTKQVVNKISPLYLSNFELYGFNISNQSLKKFIIFFMNLLPLNYYSYNINFSLYNNYSWLSWYLKFNPMNNIFYLKVYNY
jgi:hypothetical protein